MARKYEKKSEYWNNISKGNLPVIQDDTSWKPEGCGDPFYVSSQTSSLIKSTASFAARSRTADVTGQRYNYAALTEAPDRFSAIRSGMLPYSYSDSCVSMRDAIELCQKAYANVAVFRNAVSLMAEFANTDIYLDGGTKKSREFFAAWLKKIKSWKITDQYFREFYRSGNIPILRVEGKFDASDYAKLTQVYAEAGGGQNKIPLKYIFLNPCDIVVASASAFAYGQYEKVLSKFDLLKLKNPQTEEDKEIFNNLPQEAKDAISKNNILSDGIRIKLDPDSLIFNFFGKMDYEPFAIPFGYPVLEDINFKLEMKKMDQAMLRTVENVILLITMGAKPEDGGINPKNIEAMQNLFKNGSVGRTLVSDWTTKAEFIVPDINKVLGPQKYEIINRDIAEGLQNVIIGEEKYGNTQTKVQVFLEKLREARNTFLNDFLQPEIIRIAKNLGMRKFPTAKFKVTDAKDPTEMWRVVTRMMELGLLSAEQGLTAIRTGEFPNPEAEEFMLSQEEYGKNRKKGLYNPLSPVPVIAQPAPPLDPNTKYQVDNAPEPAATGKPGGAKKKKAKTPKSSGRPKNSKSKASVMEMQKVIYATESLLTHIKESMKAAHKLETLSEQQNDAALSLMQSIVCAANQDEWKAVASECIKDNAKMLSLTPREEVLELAAEHESSDYEAALLWESME
jgi:hypothetical protein